MAATFYLALMLHSFRHFGPSDPVSMNHIRQAGAPGIVTALHQIPNGQVWPREAIQERIAQIADLQGTTYPLHWAVVESVPVHEDIKTRSGNYRQYIANYIESLHNLAAEGIKRVCYNFMPILDWTRTDLRRPMPDGSLALSFDAMHAAIFDAFILNRHNVWQSYAPGWQACTEAHWQQMTVDEKQTLERTILAGLPGAEESWTAQDFNERLQTYANIDADNLRANLTDFLSEIAPVATALGMRLTIHPDDPPRPIFGLPRVVSTLADVQHLFAKVPDAANGLCFCTGSFGARLDNDLPAMLNAVADRVHFLHLRNTKRFNPAEDDTLESFYEADHLDGDTNMVQIIRQIVSEERRRASDDPEWAQIPMRPDHGHQMLDDLKKRTNPGYSAIGRLRGLAELRGVERALTAD